jgi:large subunit ribosomal protein L17e
MGKYSREPEVEAKSCKAMGQGLRVHFKNCREVGRAIRRMKLLAAIKYLENVIARKQAIPFRRFTGGCGRHAQAKQLNAPGSQVGWPVKACAYFLDILRNAEANAEFKQLDLEKLVIFHVQVNRAPVMRRRTYRAHGRIGAYMSSPAHIEIICCEKADPVAKGAAAPVKLTRKQLAQNRLKGKIVVAGGGVADEQID